MLLLKQVVQEEGKELGEGLLERERCCAILLYVLVGCIIHKTSKSKVHGL